MFHYLWIATLIGIVAGTGAPTSAPTNQYVSCITLSFPFKSSLVPLTDMDKAVTINNVQRTFIYDVVSNVINGVKFKYARFRTLADTNYCNTDPTKPGWLYDTTKHLWPYAKSDKENAILDLVIDMTGIDDVIEMENLIINDLKTSIKNGAFGKAMTIKASSGRYKSSLMSPGAFALYGGLQYQSVSISSSTVTRRPTYAPNYHPSTKDEPNPLLGLLVLLIIPLCCLPIGCYYYWIRNKSTNHDDDDAEQEEEGHPDFYSDDTTVAAKA